MPTQVVSLYSDWNEDASNIFVNVFGFDTPDPVASQAEFNEFCVDWQAAVLTKLRAVTSGLIGYIGMSMVPADGFGLGYEYTFSPKVFGNLPGDALPKFNAWSFIYRRAFVGERSGAKRFAGVPESIQKDGVAIGSALTDLPLLATALASTIVSVQDWTPKILHKLPTTPATYTGHDISGVAYQRITTQSSRKR